MSSRFVSAGGAEVKAPEGLSSTTDDAWAKAREQVERAKQPAKNEPAPGTQEGGKSLYEHLQDQKAAKQEAFEEATKLKNQFRPLDDAEVDFLESIKQKERSESASVRKQTAEQLDAFRRERAVAEQLAQEQQEQSDARDPKQWITTKKRRRPLAEDQAAGTKARKLSTNDSDKSATSEGDPEAASPTETALKTGPASGTNVAAAATEASKSSPSPHPAPSNLVAYDSDSDS
ncbi:hypothetical protein LTR70_010135 [Exophiala xenobiotica]|uniref:FAM192A/Fyv6 N-terminal domain-containing protein n=1 Tax=Lithohypha guttulata TaxID=1690604 RepID=A0ABR0JVP0_9EURO|nr:hypothetical protein LTR24_010084 [Lithohypha guttulata]KAK5309613.1 hypothetical protein LTR70_010135 [Exophiala xenobiotica]